MTSKIAKLDGANDAPTLTETLLRGVPAGPIMKLPGMGRRNVALNEFDRIGLNQVSRKSWIRSELRHHEAHNGNYMRAYDDPSIACTGCNRTLGDMFGYDATTITVPTYQVVRFVSRGELDRDKFGVYFCFDCAVNRDTMLQSMADANVLRRYRDCIAEDGDDVFRFVAVSIQEDRLHGNDAKYTGVELRLLHGGLYGGGNDPDGRFFDRIGGRTLYHDYVTANREKANLASKTKRAEALKAAAEKAAVDTQVAVVNDAAESPVESKPKRRRPSKHERDLK